MRWSIHDDERSRAAWSSTLGSDGLGRPTFASWATTSLRNFFRPAASLVQVGQAAAQPPPQCFAQAGQQCLPKGSISESRWNFGEVVVDEILESLVILGPGPGSPFFF